MYPSRELFLAGSGFSFYQYGYVERCYQRHPINNLLHLSYTRGLKGWGYLPYFSVQGNYFFVEESIFEIDIELPFQFLNIQRLYKIIDCSILQGHDSIFNRCIGCHYNNHRNRFKLAYPLKKLDPVTIRQPHI